MKKKIVSALALLIVMSFTGCKQTEAKNVPQTQAVVEYTFENHDTEDLIEFPSDMPVAYDGNGNELIIKEFGYSGSEYGFDNFFVIVENNTDGPINNITISFALLDADGNIIGSTYPYLGLTLSPGKTAKIEGLCETGECTYIAVDGYDFCTADGNYIMGSFNNAVEPLNISQASTQIDLSQGNVDNAPPSNNYTTEDFTTALMYIDTYCRDLDFQYFSVEAAEDVIVVSFVDEGLSSALSSAREKGFDETMTSWVEYTEFIFEYYYDIKMILDEIGIYDWSIQVSVLNDLNYEYTLFSIVDGIIVYDVMAN